MMRSLASLLAGILLLALAVGCTDDVSPLDLDGLERAARSGDGEAVRSLVELLGHARLNDRVYPVILALGEPATPYLLEQVGTADATQREATIAALGALKVQEAAAPIAAVLADRRLERRYTAAWALGELKDLDFAPALVAALDDPNFEVRRKATRALVKIHRPAVELLLAALPEASPRAAASIILALGDIGDPRALETLLAEATGPNQAEAMLALGKLRDKRAANALVKGLAAPKWPVRMNAAMALGPLGAHEAVVPLRRALEDEVEVVREWAARSLEMITGERMRYRNARGEMVPPDNVYH